jgi:hypothetical protein
MAISYTRGVVLPPVAWGRVRIGTHPVSSENPELVEVLFAGIRV